MIKNKNYIEVNIGGKLRKVKMNMVVAAKLSDAIMADASVLINPIKRILLPILWGLQASGEVDENFTLDELSEWIEGNGEDTGMEQSEFDALDAFVQERLGFMIETINSRLEKLAEMGQINLN